MARWNRAMDSGSTKGGQDITVDDALRTMERLATWLGTARRNNVWLEMSDPIQTAMVYGMLEYLREEIGALVALGGSEVEETARALRALPKRGWKAMARSATASAEIAALWKRLDILAAQKPELSGPISFYRAALPILQAAQGEVAPLDLDVGVAQGKIDRGAPFLVDEELPFDPSTTRDLLLQLCQVLETTGQREKSGICGQLEGLSASAMEARRLSQAVQHTHVDLGRVWNMMADHDAAGIEAMSGNLQVKADLLRTLIQNALKPALHVWAGEYAPRLDLTRWQRGQCPLCGSPATLSELQGNAATRHLRCAMCGGDWPYLRLRCARCGNDDHRSRGFLGVEGELGERYAQTCDVCRGYVKTMVAFAPTPAALLPVEDLATLHLDMIAAERGYSRPR